MVEQRRGFILGVAAYLMWGAFLLYWPLLEPAGAIEILAHRVAWSAITMLIALFALRRWRHLVAIVRSRRTFLLLLAASVTIAINWGTFIWGVNNDRVVETSLGYFINPLVTVLMGVVVLQERLRRWQWVAMGVAGVAVIGLAIEYGSPPWVAIVLACSFGTYGLMKKQAGVDAIESLTFETLVLAPLALGFLVWLASQDRGHFFGHGVSHSLLLMTTGIVTAVPLLCFGAAAIRVPMTTIGLLQYLAPILQFATGVLILHEEMSAMRWVGFVLVWVALAIFTGEALRHRRRQLALAAQASAV
ncbi:MAG: EamA family transporter RarD [Myxococcaceae bacterium]|nr:MAG: EamA family transporter RarD [Myxococcaceae bacterium]